MSLQLRIRALWRAARALLPTRLRSPRAARHAVPPAAPARVETRGRAPASADPARRLPVDTQARAGSWDAAVRQTALELAEELRRVQLDSGFLLSCYSGLWTEPVRREILGLARAVDELAAYERRLPAHAVAELARVVVRWKAFFAVASNRSVLGSEPATSEGLSSGMAPRDLLVLCRDELERFGRGESDRRDLGHGRQVG
jgi:hypothetical protein